MGPVHLLTFAIAISLLGAPVLAGTVLVPADRDATLVEHPDGAFANGSGPAFFAGRTNQEENGIRRALLRFDVAGALPPHAIIESASLTLYLQPSNPGAREVRLHLVLTDWAEGPSSASGGGGDEAQPGDATWIHTFYDQELWIHPGGDYVPAESAGLVVDEAGFYTWQSTLRLIRDVHLWAVAPHRNFGWLLTGDETTRQTAKSFASREHPDEALRPVLEITYRLPGDP